jgi:hypothetical protein
MKCNRYLAVFMAALLVAVGQVSSARASLLLDNGFFNTGVDASGGVLALQANDPHYVLTGGASATSNHPNWIANNAASQWITPAQYAKTSGSPADAPAALYTYTLTVTGSSSLIVTGQWATDNDATLKLNGNPVSTSPFGGFQSWTSFTLNGFTNGSNTLTFEVTNGSGSSGNPTGLRVEFLTAVVPEASTIAVWSVLSLVGAGVAYRKRMAKA